MGLFDRRESCDRETGDRGIIGLQPRRYPACNQIDVGLGLVTPGGGSGTDAFVGEYTVYTGQAVWVDRLEGPGNDYFETALANGPNNTTFVGGYFDQSTTFATSGASPMFTGGGDRDVFIAQLTSSGGIGMTKTFADPAFEEVTSLAWTGSEIVAGGFFAGMATFGNTMLSSMDFDVWIGKLAVADGAPVWTVPLGGSGPDKYPYVAVDAQGNIYAAGTVSGTATFGTYSVGGAGGLDIFVVKLRNSDGGVIWATSFGSAGDDTAANVAINSAGELLVSGTVSGPIETGGPFAGGTDAVLAAYNGDGTRLWTKVIGSTGMDNGFGVASGTDAFYANVDLAALLKTVRTLDPYKRPENLPSDGEMYFASGDRYLSDVFGAIEHHLRSDFRPRLAVDFGCSVGRIAIPLARRCEAVVGLDVSTEALAEAGRNATRLGVTNARWLVSDDGLSQLLEPVELFHSYNVLQHLPVSRGMAIIARAVTRLAPGGVIAVHVPYADRASALRHAVNWAQAHVPGIHALANLARRRPVDYPHMLMNAYDLTAIVSLLAEHRFDSIYFKLIDQGRYPDAIVMARAPI